MLIAGQRHLHAVLEQYVAHYSQHRPHRARNLQPPESRFPRYCPGLRPADSADTLLQDLRRADPRI